MTLYILSTESQRHREEFLVEAEAEAAVALVDLVIPQDLEAVALEEIHLDHQDLPADDHPTTLLVHLVLLADHPVGPLEADHQMVAEAIHL